MERSSFHPGFIMTSTTAPAPSKPGFFERLSLAFKVLGDADLAQRVRDGAPAVVPPTTQALPSPTSPPVVQEKIVERIVEKSNPEAGALLVLSILQRDGRLIDFVHEDVAGFPDADVGAAARVVHAGCRKALAQYFKLEPVNKAGEGAPVVVEKGFDPSTIRLAGNVSGEPPFKGKLAHGGWRAVEVRLPDRPASIDGRIVAPAEVEL